MSSITRSISDLIVPLTMTNGLSPPCWLAESLLTLNDQVGLNIGAQRRDGCRTLHNGDLLFAVSDASACLLDARGGFRIMSLLNDAPLPI